MIKAWWERWTQAQPSGVRDAIFLAAACLTVAVLAFSAGRFTAPLQVEERVEYSDLWHRKEKTKAKTSSARETKTTTTPVLLPMPDGGVLLASKTVTESSERSATSTDTEIDALRESLLRSSTITTNRPDWRVGALVGGRFSGGPTGLVVGGIAERRIIGGVSLAAWGLVEIDTRGPAPAVTAGTVGGGVLAEF